MPNDHDHIINRLVEGFLENRIRAEDAISQWPDIDNERNSLIRELWHRLTHFIDDADIRRDDSDYETGQRSHIRRLLEKFRVSKGFANEP